MQKRIEFFAKLLSEHKNENPHDRHNWANEYTDTELVEMYPELFEDGDYKEHYQFLEDFIPY